MKRIICSLLLSVVALVVAMPSVSHAAAAKKTPIPPKHTVIATISSDSITIDTGRTTKTYKIDKFTRLSFGGKTVTAGDLKPGMRVSVTQGSDKEVASVITASPAPKPDAPAKK